MKKIIFGILLLTSLNGLAQHPQLLGQSWNLEQVGIADQVYLYPYEGHTATAYFTETSFTIQYPFCSEAATDEIAYEGTDSFTVSGTPIILLGFCMHQAMSLHYWVYQSNDPMSLSYEIVAQGDYHVLTVTNPSGYYAIYNDIPLDVDQFAHPEINVYFNAQNGVLEISGADVRQISQLTIYNQLGQYILSQNDARDNVNLDALSDGVYFVRMSLDDGGTYTHKFIKH